MPARRLLAACALLALSGCSALPDFPGRGLVQILVGQHVSLGFPKAVSAPDAVTLELGLDAGAAGLGGTLFRAVSGESLEQKLGRALKKAALPLRQGTASAFRRELEAAQLFGKVSDQGGDLLLGLGIARWGLSRDRESGKVSPILDMEATLSLPGFGMVWRGTRSAADAAEAVKAGLDLGLEAVASNPGSFDKAMALIAADLSRQLVAEMRRRPPKRQAL